MKQLDNLTAGTINSGTLSWTSITRSMRLTLKALREQIAETVDHQRMHLSSLAAALLIASLFLSGSYLFLVQLAKHGW